MPVHSKEAAEVSRRKRESSFRSADGVRTRVGRNDRVTTPLLTWQAPLLSPHRSAWLGRGGGRDREGMAKNGLRIIDEGEGELAAEILRHLLEVPLVPAGQDHFAYAGPVRRQDLFLDASDGKHLAA